MRRLFPIILSGLISARGWWLGNFVAFMTATFNLVPGAAIGWYLGGHLDHNFGG